MQKKLLVHSCRLQQTDSWWQCSLFHSKFFFSFLLSFSFFFSFFLSLFLFVFFLSLSLPLYFSFFFSFFLSFSFSLFHMFSSIILENISIQLHTHNSCNILIYMCISHMVNMFTLSAHQQSKQCSKHTHTHTPKIALWGGRGGHRAI